MSINTMADLQKTPANNVDFLGSDATGAGNASAIDTVRQNLGAIIARAYDDQGGVMTVGGSANAITLASNSTYQALRAGLQLTVKLTSAITAAATLNLDSLGAKAIRLQGDSALSGDETKAGGYYDLVYDEAYNTAAGAWVLKNPENVNQGRIVLKQSTSPTPTAEGDIQWDTNDDRIIVGDGSGQKTFYPGVMADTTPGAAQAATQAEQEAATSTARAVTPARQQYHPSAAKCWGITTGGGTPVLAASYNITSIADGGPGELNVTIATDFSSSNYAPMATANSTNTRSARVQITGAGTFTVFTADNSGANSDPSAGYSFSAFGDQ